MERKKGIFHLSIEILTISFLSTILTLIHFILSPAIADIVQPYHASSVIGGVTFDWSSLRQLAPGSDTWAITWAKDNNQYATWGDGGGFGGTNEEGRVSLGVACVIGDWNHFSGRNVWGGNNPQNSTQFDGKSYGIISVDGILYMWVSPGSDTRNYEEARLATSTDHGVTWTQSSWAFTKPEGIMLPTFCQFGKDYHGARDSFVYVYAVRLQYDHEWGIQRPGQVDLMRVPKDHLCEHTKYKFFGGLDAQGNVCWTDEVKARVPVFIDLNGVGCVSVTYNQGLRRYLLTTEHTQSFHGNFGLFDAPEPWGPWTTVTYNTGSSEFGTAFFWNFSNKWTNPKGIEFTILYTGIGRYDSWNSLRGKFIFNSPPNSSVP